MSAAKKRAVRQVTKLLAKGPPSPEELSETLGKLGDDAVPALLAALEDNDYRIRMAAAICLGELNDEAAVEELVESLSDSSKNVQRCAADALTCIGQAAVEPLLDAQMGSGGTRQHRRPLRGPGTSQAAQ